MFYIMVGYHYEPKRKVTISDIIAEEGGDVTIYVAEREVSYDRSAPIFLISHGNSAQDPNVLGWKNYTQDTGMGHKNKNKVLRIINAVYVNKDGIIAYKANNEGIGEKRSIWVCK